MQKQETKEKQYVRKENGKHCKEKGGCMHDRTKHETTDNGQLNPKLNKKEKQEKHIRKKQSKTKQDE